VAGPTIVTERRTARIGGHAVAAVTSAFGYRLCVVTRYARQERAALADALAAAGPDAPTLCTGWTTRDLAAHVVLRERSPVAAAGIVVPQLAGHTERAQRRLAAHDFVGLVDQVRHPPAWSLLSNPLVDESTNLVEMYVHHEDVRRGRPGWAPRPLPPGLADALWERVGRVGRLALRRFPATVVAQWPGHGRRTLRSGGPEVMISGEPGELLLYLTGRQRAAMVETTGPEEAAERLRRARLGA